VNEAVSPSREADRKQSPPTLLIADNVAGVSRGGINDNRNWSDPGVLCIVRSDGLRDVRFDPIVGGGKVEQGSLSMVKPNSEGEAREHDELSTDELNAVSGGSIEIREVIIKAAVDAVHTTPRPAAPKPIPVPYPNQGTKV
jgi:hypothetical protein